MNKLTILGGASALILTVSAYAAAGDHAAKMDSDGNGSISRAEAMAAADAHFAKLDVDGNGQINVADKEAGMKRHFGKIDTNGDGVISEDEFTAAHAEKMEKRKGHMDHKGDGKMMHGRKHGDHAGLAKADSDGDKNITQAEFRAVAEARFAAADTDGNGEISKEERQAAYRAKRTEHHKGR